MVTKIAFGGNFYFSRVTGMIVGTGLHSYRSFVLLRPSYEDCLQSVCSKYRLSLWMKYPFDSKTKSNASSVLPFLVVRTQLLDNSNCN